VWSLSKVLAKKEERDMGYAKKKEKRKKDE